MTAVRPMDEANLLHELLSISNEDPEINYQQVRPHFAKENNTDKTDTTEGSEDYWIKQTLVGLVQAYVGQLRSIKEIELAWLDRFSVIVFPVLGFLLAINPGTHPLSVQSLTILTLFYLAITMWIQKLLLNERLSYYRVMRTLNRAQNYLGLFGINFLPQFMADASFPKGLGPNPKSDGTKPFSSFLNRQVYTVILFTAIVAAVIYQDETLLPVSLLIIIDILWLVTIFRIDKETLYREAMEDKDLIGTSPSWYPHKKH